MGWIHLGWCIGASEHFGLGAWRCVEKVGSLYLDALMGRMGLSTFLFAFLRCGALHGTRIGWKIKILEYWQKEKGAFLFCT
jgi:hypothetical protein